MVVLLFGVFVVFSGYDFCKINVLFLESLIRFGLNLRKFIGFFLYFRGNFMMVCVGEMVIIVVIFFLCVVIVRVIFEFLEIFINFRLCDMMLVCVSI